MQQPLCTPKGASLGMAEQRKEVRGFQAGDTEFAYWGPPCPASLLGETIGIFWLCQLSQGFLFLRSHRTLACYRAASRSTG